MTQPRDDSKVVQIVLAAGRSRRMGTSKPRLDFDGKTALELVVAAGRDGGCARSVVVIGHQANEVRTAHNFPREEVEWVLNDDPASAQLRSLQLGLAALSIPTAFFIHPVDYPLATSNDYRLLLDALAAGTAQETVYILSHDRRRGHPILCRAEVAGRLQALRENQSARDVILHESIRYVDTANSGVLHDMDTPQSYDELLRLYRERSASASD